MHSRRVRPCRRRYNWQRGRVVDYVADRVASHLAGMRGGDEDTLIQPGAMLISHRNVQRERMTTAHSKEAPEQMTTIEACSAHSDSPVPGDWNAVR